MEKGQDENCIFNANKILKPIGTNKAQITIFVIIAIVLVVGIAGFFLARTYIFTSIPKSIQPIQDSYSSCISKLLTEGASIMASQGGYIYYEDFEPGSEYAPFSSVLEFVGIGVPYWYYISANGIKKEQIPTENDMEAQLGKYISEQVQLGRCDLSSFREQGFNIELAEEVSSKVTIEDSKIKGSLSRQMIVTFGEDTYTFRNFESESDSRLGKLYKQALEIYNYEKESSFLENYSLDVLYNYAPVSGTLLNCTPVVWNPYDVFKDLKNGLSANIGAVKVNGDYYSGKGRYTPYFIVGREELEVKDFIVNFLYSSNWPARFEVWPTSSNLMIAKPIGTQPGMSALGFCYAPYKFVYDMYFPVLIQLTTLDSTEVFQFPVSVIIDKNMPRKSMESPGLETKDSLCNNANTEITINTYNINLEPVEAYVDFKCLSDTCTLGKTKVENSSGVASLKALTFQCGNGILIVKAEGYSEKRYYISTNEETTADIILDKESNLGVEVYVDGRLTSDNSVIILSEVLENSTNFVDSLTYPLSNVLSLSEGDYKIDLKVYGKGNINIPATTTKQCVKTSSSGVLALFGVEKEKCYDITVPAQQLTNIPIAGGYARTYFTPDQLENARVLRIYANSIKTPTSVEEIQTVYDEVEAKKIMVELF